MQTGLDDVGGMVESRHGTYTGSAAAPNGDVRPLVRGVRLDGTLGNMEILDTADGALDGDPPGPGDGAHAVYPGAAWRLYGVDANNDNVISPYNFDGAASAAGYLCWRGKDLSTRGAGTRRCAYNLSDQYARSVRTGPPPTLTATPITLTAPGSQPTFRLIAQHKTQHMICLTKEQPAPIHEQVGAREILHFLVVTRPLRSRSP